MRCRFAITLVAGADNAFPCPCASGHWKGLPAPPGAGPVTEERWNRAAAILYDLCVAYLPKSLGSETRNEQAMPDTLQRNPTPPLTPPQETALAALLLGKTVTAAAQTAGVDRTTIYRWLKEDFDFLAALNRGRQEL